MYCKSQLLAADRRSAFTIVELLVVVAILAVLIALLAPMLRGAGSSARLVTCLKHMQQIGMASTVYMNDHRGVTIPVNVDLGERYEVWTTLLVDTEALPSGAAQPTDEITDRASPLRCPEDIGEHYEWGVPDGSWGDIHRGKQGRRLDNRRRLNMTRKSDDAGNIEYYVPTSYAINGSNPESNTNGGFRDFPHKRIGSASGMGVIRRTQFEVSPAELVSIYDGFLWHLSSADFVSLRHNGSETANMVFMDGRADSIPGDELQSTWVNDDERDRSKSPTWWYRRN
jgi:prepilin-type N-terminal cleavage/methylation domain-containing protein/prepilin-type processing-associated H-X9-DG protein